MSTIYNVRETWQTLKAYGLIMEGGGMRGLYTCGVLERFMELNIRFPYMVGVSAGACNGLSYGSWQPGRNERVILGFMKDKRYMGVRNLIKTGNYFGMDFIFNTIPNQHIPFDYEGFMAADHEFEVGTTDIETGEAVFYGKKDIDPLFHVLRASASLPLLSKPVPFQGRLLMDGGIVDAIPVDRALSQGCEKLVIVLTRHRGYYKNPSKGIKVVEKAYKKYPKLIEVMRKRHEIYNVTLAQIEQLEREGKAFVIQPVAPLEVDRLEKDRQKLKALHDQGYEDATRLTAELLQFLGVDQESI